MSPKPATKQRWRTLIFQSIFFPIGSDITLVLEVMHEKTIKPSIWNVLLFFRPTANLQLSDKEEYEIYSSMLLFMNITNKTQQQQIKAQGNIYLEPPILLYSLE